MTNVSQDRQEQSPYDNDRPPVEAAVLTIGIVVVISVALFLAAVALGGAGHGVLFHLPLLYPYAVILSVPMQPLGPVPHAVACAVLALLQFPVYAAIVMRSSRSRARRTVNIIVWIHLALAIGAYCSEC